MYSARRHSQEFVLGPPEAFHYLPLPSVISLSIRSTSPLLEAKSSYGV